MAQVQVVDTDVGVVGGPLRRQRPFGVDGDGGLALQLHAAAALAGRQVGAVARAVGGEAAVEEDCSTLLPPRSSSEQEVQLCLGLYLDVALQSLQVAHVRCRSLDAGVQGCGQVEGDAGDVELLHVAVHRPSDGERAVGVALDELLWQLSGGGEDVLLAYLGEEAYPDVAGRLLVEGREVYVAVKLDVGVGGLQHQLWHLDMVEGRVEPDAARECCHLQSALVAECRLADEERCASRRICDGVYAHHHVAQTYRLVGQPTVADVDASYIISRCGEVGRNLSGHGLAQADAAVERVAGQVEGEVGAADCEAVGIDLPLQVRRRGVCLSRVAQGDVELCVGQACPVHHGRLPPQVDAFRL